MFDRTVTITPRITGAANNRGTEAITDGTPFDLRGLRELKVDEENVEERDQQIRSYRYIIEARHPDTGEVIAITGFDRLTDNDETFEIIGSPKYVVRRRRGIVHHVELDARRVGPGSDRPPS